MDWLGIGVFILGLAFAGLVVILIPVMKKLTATLGNTADTVSTVNKSVGEMTGEITVILHNANETLTDVHGKMEKVNPVFDIIHDTGQAAHHLTSTLVRFTGQKTDKAKEGADAIDRSQLEGLLRGAAFFYYLKQMSKTDKNEA
ncbi:DUF948 domain-containing protein [Salisediminibacterium halotolerans]|uniref:Uncharacterized protein YoxC, contains an MCP-like domain n=1 Tax=Salisediminibacterium halotolerans TaxID=517425 RepID=A0A1H9VX05_9BACI|nr:MULTISPECIES: DUF948 domain-containing protein [Salisediminibacterium]RLJ71785.1 uncharacterized protein YoxC [Actinophytocola xinjiangensis]RPE86935.1 uncharacterized protein YoxC [Salisediminibacterium halotolerans]TWG32998.1 uncharacterized protein YoxC [Salisediminibacterium halotolerans]SES25813.1 Uncharacterized protein YoxC, contains an MCP-like domain [Salisediminibacterium haloalkalitolerans]GEL08607.1 hypothetical protein SHA02_20230 [Salisediminibacterium halotolerans]